MPAVGGARLVRVRLPMIAARGLLIGLVLLPLLTVPGAVAGAQSKGDPDELWEAFPLEPTPAPSSRAEADSTSEPPAATPSPSGPRAVERDDGAGTLTLAGLIALGLGAVGVAAAVMRLRWRSRSGPADPPEPARTSPRAPARPRTAPLLLARQPAPRTPGPPQNGSQACRIQLWHGHIKKRFYALPSGGGPWLAESPFFKLELGEAVEESDAAREALHELVRALRAQGWEITGQGDGPWDVELRRRTDALAAPTAPRH